jgi:hypothetical protein
LPTKSFMTPTRPMARKKMANLPKIQMTQAWLVMPQKSMKIQNQWLKNLPRWSYPPSRWIAEYRDLQTYHYTYPKTRNWLPSWNCTRNPQRSSSQQTHSPMSLSWFWK